MKWITSKIKLQAAGLPGSQMDLPMSTPELGPVTNHINNPRINPFHDIEGPETHGFSITDPSSTRGIGDGIRGAKFHNGDTRQRLAVVKNDANSHLKEPLVYQISKHIVPGLVPPTVARDHANAETTGTRQGHSVQQAVPGDTLAYTGNKMDIKAKHPDYAKTAVFDWLIGNHDRHDNNIIYDHNTNRLHAIDNGGAFSYGPDHPIYDDFENPNSNQQYGVEKISGNMQRSKLPIPDDLRQNILKADSGKLKDLFDRVGNHPRAKGSEAWRGTENGFLKGNFDEGHPNVAWNNFKDRLGALQDHLGDDSVRTMPDLYERLYPGDFVNNRLNRANDNTGGTSVYDPNKPHKPTPPSKPFSLGVL